MKKKPKTIVQYLIEQLATQLIIQVRQELQKLDKKDKRHTADDMNYLAQYVQTHIENSDLQNEVIAMVDKMLLRK